MSGPPQPPPVASDVAAPSLPSRPDPSQTVAERCSAWLAWFGLTRLVLAAVSVLIVVGGGYWLLHVPSPDTVASLPLTSGAGGSASSETVPAATLAPPAVAAPVTTTPGPLIVHVAGAVAAPGVYPLAPGSRVIAALDAAGGGTTDADLDGLNLAAPLADGQRVYVPVAGEVDPATVADGAPPPAGALSGGASGPIDLNTATAAELETLPGVGPATAAAIVDDRTRNGPFATVDDLDRVSGIGPAKLEQYGDPVLAVIADVVAPT